MLARIQRAVLAKLQPERPSWQNQPQKKKAADKSADSKAEKPAENSFEKNKTGNQEFDLPHGELNPAPEQAPVNENKKDGGNEEGDGVENKESNVTVPKNEPPAHTVDLASEPDMGGRSMAVVAPRK